MSVQNQLDYNFEPAQIDAPYSVARFSGSNGQTVRDILNIWEIGKLQLAQSSYQLFLNSTRRPEEIGINQIYAFERSRNRETPLDSDLVFRAIEDLGTKSFGTTIQLPRNTFDGNIQIAGSIAPFYGIVLPGQTSSIISFDQTQVYESDDLMENTSVSLGKLQPFLLAPVLNPFVAAALGQQNILAFTSFDEVSPYGDFTLESRLWFVIQSELLSIDPNSLYAYTLLQSIFNISSDTAPKRVAVVNMRQNSDAGAVTSGILCVASLRKI